MKERLKALPRLEVPSKTASMHPDDEWESMKRPFHRYYIDENRSLNETIHLMKAEHDFSATRRQWERKVKGWGYSKYIQSDARQQFIEESLAAGMTEEQILNAPNIPVDDSGGDDRTQRRNWRRYVKRQYLSRSRSTHTSPARSAELTLDNGYDLAVPDAGISDLSPSSAWTSPFQMSNSSSWPSPVQLHGTIEGETPTEPRKVPDIFVSYWDETLGQLIPQGSAFDPWSSVVVDGPSTKFEPNVYASSFRAHGTSGSQSPVFNSMRTIVQSPLNIKDIRLINVYPGIPESDLVLERFESSLKTPYEALSYCWGNLTPNQNIIVNGEYEKVTQNLYHALKALRHQHTTRTLWVDAMCINQRDIDEKNEQVRQMSAIYSNAQQVCCWLGQETKDSGLAVDFVHSVTFTITIMASFL